MPRAVPAPRGIDEQGELTHTFARRYFASPEQGLELSGELRPKSKFLGNSAANIMEGESHVRFLDGVGAKDGEYDITMPNM